MKTYITFLKVISIVLVLFMTSCFKDSHVGESNNQTEVNPENLIIDFVNKMDSYKSSPNLKSGEKMQVDSAIWYIDATLNYYYASANYPCSMLYWDTSYFEMSLLNSYEAAYNEVFESYDASLGKLSMSYQNIVSENKQFMMAMVEDMGELPNLKRKLRIITITGTGALQPSEDFGEDEAYLYNRNAVYDCNGDPALGAPKIFETKLNAHYNPAPGGNCRWSFYGPTISVTYNYSNYQLNSTLSNYLDFKIFAASQIVGDGITSETECLEWNQNNSGIHEMQFYYDYLKVLINEWLASGQNTGNMKFAPSLIESYDLNINNIRTIWHKPVISYRKRMKVCSDVIEIPVED